MASTIVRYDFVILGGGMVGTYLARLLVEQGHGVAIIERGPAALAQMREPTPQVESAGRNHLGITGARNQVLGGNAYFWGGGLIRSERESLEGVLGLEESSPKAGAESLAADFAAVERALGLNRSPSRAPFDHEVAGLGRCDIAEISVLPGRARNIAAEALRIVATSSRSRVFCEAEQIEFRQSNGGGVVDEVSFTIAGAQHRIAARSIVVSAGTVDSNLLIAAQASNLDGVFADEVGRVLHDHVSLPLFRMSGGSTRSFLDAIEPRFEQGVVIGRHYEMETTGGWGARGFLHFQFYFAEAPLYRQIKDVLALRQQRASLMKIGRAIGAMVPRLPELARIGYGRYMRNRLHLSAEVPIVATLDFETYPSPSNRLDASGPRPVMHWDIRPEDVATFHELARRSERLMSHFANRHGVVAEPMGDWSSLGQAESYLRRAGGDTFHLGGGLPAGRDDEPGFVDTDLRLRGTTNVYVISSAVFRRPGVANPTLTLLALANRFARRQAGARSQGPAT